MAYEAVIIELLGNKGDPIRYTVLDANAIPKGTIMELEDPRTMKAVSGAGVVIAGIAASEKVANDGQTSLAVYTNGIFDLTVDTGASATLGTFVRAASATNEVTASTTLDNETGKAVGKALETGTADEVIAVRVLL